jgi:hypothetical protein
MSELVRTLYRMSASKPTASLSQAMDTFYPLTLSLYLGTLTTGWVVPLSDIKFTPTPLLPKSTTLRHLELDKKPRDFSP